METKVLEILAELCEDTIVTTNMDIELFETGLLDSLTFAELLFEIEDQFGIIISPSEIEHKDMDTPRKIINLIKARI